MLVEGGYVWDDDWISMETYPGRDCPVFVLERLFGGDAVGAECDALGEAKNFLDYTGLFCVSECSR